VEWTQLSQDRLQMQAIVKRVVRLLVKNIEGEFLNKLSDLSAPQEGLWYTESVNIHILFHHCRACMST
jgi:hypothetical protein